MPDLAQKLFTPQTTSSPVRATDRYRVEYSGGTLVEKWDSLIDWDARAASEGSFFIDTLRAHGAKRVLDVATGTGFHSVRLLEAGFDVVSADGSPQMLAKAFQNGRERGLLLRTVQADWRWLNRDIAGRFDAVICLGNSLTHLFAERDRRKALAEFYAALKHDGILIVDQRNYDAILDNSYNNRHCYYYCGEGVRAEPELASEELVRFRYDFADDGSVFHLNFYPLRRRYLRRLLFEVGFQQVNTLGDFKETYRNEEPDFFIHVAHKLYGNEAGGPLPEIEV
jgi:SAM-dependent methyltransferase